MSLVTNADLPSYTPTSSGSGGSTSWTRPPPPARFRPRCCAAGNTPWKTSSLWRFNPCVVHGDLHEDNLLVEGDAVTAVTGWTDLRIGDPADDFAWLVASNEAELRRCGTQPLHASRRDAPDAHLLRRAALSAEFALAQYLVKGHGCRGPGMIAEAEAMLATLAEDIAEHGGQPIA